LQRYILIQPPEIHENHTHAQNKSRSSAVYSYEGLQNFDEEQMKYRLLTTSLIVLTLAVVGAQAQDAPAEASENEAAQVFKSLFEDKIQAARASFVRTDDVELAGELLAAAKESTEHKVLLGLLCDAAADLGGRHPDGYETAITALQLLTDNVPERRNHAATKKLMLRRRQYSAARTIELKKQFGALLVNDYLSAADASEAGEDYTMAIQHMRNALQMATYTKAANKDQISLRYKSLLAKKQMQDEVAHLKAALKKDPKDEAAATRLITLYIEVSDNPDKARKYTFLVSDDALKANVTNAAKEDLKSLKPEESLALGDWYLKFAKKVTARNPQAMYRRAYTYFHLYLDVSEGKGLGAVKAKLMAKQIESIAKTRGYELVASTTVASADAVKGKGTSGLATLPANLKPIRVPLAPTKGDKHAVKDMVRGASAGDIERVKESLAAGGALNQPWGSDGTALYAAIRAPRENIEMVRFLLGKGADPNYVYERKRLKVSMMSVAASRSHTATVRLLRQYGYKSADKDTDLTYALLSKDPQWVGELLKKETINRYFLRSDGKLNVHPFYYVLESSKSSPAIATQTLQTVKTMLALGANPNAHLYERNGERVGDQTILNHTARVSTAAVYEALIKAGAKSTGAAIFNHITMGNLEGVEKHFTSIDVKTPGRYPESLLSVAVRSRPINAGIVEFLLKKGAKPNEVGYKESTILTEIISSSRFNPRGEKLVQLLLSHGADAKQAGRNKQTPLHVAAMQLREREQGENIVRLLLAKKVDVNAIDDHGFSPMGYLPPNDPMYKLIAAAGGKIIRKSKKERKEDAKRDSNKLKGKPPKVKGKK
jgi:ankyrin repeat protein